MKTRAAVAWEAGKPLSIEAVDLDGPKDGEVLVRLVATGVCHTDAFTLSGDDPEGIFPSVLGHEGAGVVVLEEYEHARARGAKIYCEVLGYGLSGDAHHITAPSEDGDGGYRSMQAALKRAGLEASAVDYINAHGTSTPVGDVGEIEAVRRVFGKGTTPPVSSTKSMTGHAQGAAGALEAIFSLLMLEHDFIAGSINVKTLDPALDASEIATETVLNAGLDSVMTNSFGFGGTNGSMILSKYHG